MTEPDERTAESAEHEDLGLPTDLVVVTKPLDGAEDAPDEEED
jgi:hypothetical protein